MKLPSYEFAVVPEQKIVAYLLSFTHPDGKSKAAFFSRFGFTSARWQEFANALIEHAATNEVAEIRSTAFGTMYVVTGLLLTPDRRNPVVRVVWFVADGDTVPRLVSAYPQKGTV